MIHRRLCFATPLVFSCALHALPALAQLPQDAFSALHWRSIGPLRGGRTRALAGVPSQPYTFYIAQVNGGVWKTTDAGRTWTPIFDDQPTQSVGAIAIAPSDPNTLYVGSGEGLPRPDLSVGDGVYKSTDGGKTWRRLGLNDAQQIPQIAIDPTNPNRLFVAALGHPYGPNRERGIFRSTDGGQTFAPVLQKDENSGGNDVDVDPSNPQIVYANLWEQRQGPWENSAWTGNGGGLFKSTDGGNTWKQLTSGLPSNVNQVNLTIAPSNSNRLYAAVASNGPPPTVGIYRSDDAGESWTKITTDTRPASRIGGGDLPVPTVNPKDPDMVIMASTVSWKSTDGGRTWAPFKGAPGGDDYQSVWINPNDPNIILLVSDQGAVVTLNGGQTWSSWYNQSTAQLYHVMADNSFPYRLCSGQQESGSACVSSRGNWGEVTERDWAPVGVDEYGYVAPDPRNPDLIYGGRQVTRFDRRTGQVSVVGPLAGRLPPAAGQPNPYRQVRTHPVVFSQADPKSLYFGNNFLWKTIDGGLTWTRISPDVTRKTWTVPGSVGKYRSDTGLVRQRGVIYSIAPSPLTANRIWFGTDDGLIYTTSNGGGAWRDVTPRQISAWWKVFMIDAGHFDTATAYAAVNTLRLDDMRPHLYRTHDGGRTWRDISAGIPDMGPANALREDPRKKGLLYAATEKGVYVSFDDGDSWRSLRLNLPASSVRDLIVKDDDIAVATHGRGFWILDDVTPLRQIDSTMRTQSAALFRPQPALRVRWNMNDDTPLPPDEPMGENPPEGASINYWLSRASDVAIVEIVRADGRVVRRYSSADSLPWTIPNESTTPLPLYWYRQPQTLSSAAGMHRFFWDVHYEPLKISIARPGGGGGGGGGPGLPISATPRNTAPSPTTPFASPGTYSVRLTAGGKTYAQPLVVRQDPRVRTPAAQMRVLYALTDSMYFIASDLVAANAQVNAIAEGNKTLTRGPKAIADAAGNLYGKAADLRLADAAASVARVMNLLQGADVAVTASQRTAIDTALREGRNALAKWNALKARDLVDLNAKLKAAGLMPIGLN